MSAKLSLVVYLNGGIFNMNVGNQIISTGGDGYVGAKGSPNQTYLMESVLNGITATLNLSTGLPEIQQDLLVLDPNSPQYKTVCTSSDQVAEGQCLITRTSPSISIFYIKSAVDGNYLYVEDSGLVRAFNSQTKLLTDVKRSWFYIETIGVNTYTIMSAKFNKYIGISNGSLISNGQSTMFTFTQVQNPTQQSVINKFNSMFTNNNFDVCCDQVQAASYTDDYAACSYSGYFFDDNRYSGNCINYMKSKCSNGDLDNYLCIDYCNNNDLGINCDKMTEDYCNSLGAEALNRDVCNCFWPAQYLDNYYNSLSSTFPNFTFDRDPTCTHVKCSQLQSGAINRYSYKKNPRCPDIQMCVNTIKFTNEGTIDTNSININQSTNCFGGAVSSTPTPSPGSPPPSGSTSPSATPTSSPTSSPSTSQSGIISSTLRVIVLIILAFLILCFISAFTFIVLL